MPHISIHNRGHQLTTPRENSDNLLMSTRIWHHGIAAAANPWKFWNFPDPAVLHRSTRRLLRRPSKSRPNSSLPSLSFMTALLPYSNRTNGPAVSFHGTVIANLSPFDADARTLGPSPWVGRAQERERKNERTKDRIRRGRQLSVLRSASESLVYLRRKCNPVCH
ncbi:hypothetical protein BC827DRAFT_347937 [Russula dissimulans]|nr:hypothetical protein BC827DRAFT_347937 [Russula dissimulans]